MKWIPLTDENQLEDIINKSSENPQVIFKYSNRCSLSDVARDRLERKPVHTNATFYFLDIINYRRLSNLIASRFQVRHESPQVLLIHNGKCIYEESHMGIRMDELMAQLLLAA